MQTKTSQLLLFMLLLIAGSSFAQPASAINDSLKIQMIRDWQRAKTYTKSYIDAMPENGLGFKPTPEMRSFSEQMLHLANANVFFVSTATSATNPYKGRDFEKEENLKSDKAALIKVVMDTYDFAINSIQSLESKNIFSFPEATNGLPKMNRFTLINKGFEHQTHHRGQSTVYLRLKGVTPPNEMLF